MGTDGWGATAPHRRVAQPRSLHQRLNELPRQAKHSPCVPHVLRTVESHFAHSVVFEPGRHRVEPSSRGSYRRPWRFSRMGFRIPSSWHPWIRIAWDYCIAELPTHTNIPVGREKSAGHMGGSLWNRGRLLKVVPEEEGEFFAFPIQPRSLELRINFQARGGDGVWAGIGWETELPT